MQLENIHRGIRCLPAVLALIPAFLGAFDKSDNATKRRLEKALPPIPFGPLGSGMLLAYFTCQSLLRL